MGISRILERTVADDHDHGAVATSLALAERDAHGCRKAPAKPSAGHGEEGRWFGDRPGRMKIGEIRRALLYQDRVGWPDFAEGPRTLVWPSSDFAQLSGWGAMRC